ncbi:MAG: hypothetical protein IJK98_00805, partial [Clostridia bacterium]|nr:hypothetical protein [Clostridia bacterium]
PTDIAAALDEENDPQRQPERYDDLSNARAQGAPPGADSLKAFAAAHAAGPEGPQEDRPDYSVYLDEYAENEELTEQPPTAPDDAAAPVTEQPPAATDGLTEDDAEDDEYDDFSAL